MFKRQHCVHAVIVLKDCVLSVTEKHIAPSSGFNVTLSTVHVNYVILVNLFIVGLYQNMISPLLCFYHWKGLVRLMFSFSL